MDGIPEGHADTGLDNGRLVRIILPMKEALCLPRNKAMGTVGGWSLCGSAVEIHTSPHTPHTAGIARRR
eukprot:110185-Chlamydomonas_euryale.AAC.2